ncbi:hypothetical protein Tsubulata_028456 [Turnera subulata]|uniref:Patatin n=1 Tax=Turnera subulata TaxID=218843 RepID=A0A9Q0F1Q7_9ROSI|nr:hypothetical protein Tsubulata_028456 [Turnera subulata]
MHIVFIKRQIFKREMLQFFTRKPKPPSSPFSPSSSPFMAPSLSSLLYTQPQYSFFPSDRNPNPNLAHRRLLRPKSLSFATRNDADKATQDDNFKKIKYPPIGAPPPEEKKSFAVATGELFLGIASRILRTGNKNGAPSPSPSPSSRSGSGFSLFERRNGGNGNGAVDYEERIGAVMEDEIEPEVIWEQRVKDIEAEKERRVVTSPGFSFSAAGLLFPYHLGVAQFLIEKGYIKETTPLAGSSAGAIVCAVIASGESMEQALKATKILAEDCRLKGTAFRLGAVLRDVLEKFLPDDVHIRSNGRVRVAVTQILWRPRGLLVDQFDSKEDLINAVVTSSFIPGYLAPRPATMFRNRLCIDGGLTLFMPPTSAAQTVRVCAFPASRLGFQGIGISPDLNPEFRATPRELFNWALEPAEDVILDQLFELGYANAAVWAEENPVDEIVQDDSPLIGNPS